MLHWARCDLAKHGKMYLLMASGGVQPDELAEPSRLLQHCALDFQPWSRACSLGGDSIQDAACGGLEVGVVQVMWLFMVSTPMSTANRAFPVAHRGPSDCIRGPIGIPKALSLA